MARTKQTAKRSVVRNNSNEAPPQAFPAIESPAELELKRNKLLDELQEALETMAPIQTGYEIFGYDSVTEDVIAELYKDAEIEIKVRILASEICARINWRDFGIYHSLLAQLRNNLEVEFISNEEPPEEIEEWPGLCGKWDKLKFVPSAIEFSEDPMTVFYTQYTNSIIGEFKSCYNDVLICLRYRYSHEITRFCHTIPFLKIAVGLAAQLPTGYLCCVKLREILEKIASDHVDSLAKPEVRPRAKAGQKMRTRSSSPKRGRKLVISLE